MSPLAIAPMIDWTYTHFRVLMRLLAPRALLYTDMQTAGAIFNNPSRSLQYHSMEAPLALQLGGSDQDSLVKCAQLAEQQGYAEVNLNLGCPSDRVQAGRFGACLMAEPDRVVDCIAAMKRAVRIPVTAKTRIGIDEQDSYEFFSTFAHRLVDAGCDKLIVHARKAWLHGLNPKQNRTIPPLHYDYVYRIKQALQSIPVVINGHINTIDEINLHLQHVDGVMLGRLACQNPYAIATIHHALYPLIPQIPRDVVIQQYLNYAQSMHERGVPLSILLKPILNMLHAMPGAKAWKEQLMAVQRLGSWTAIDRLTVVD
ncbi:tRNA dihydrouridine(20/20a) synthase DusA [bacterium]|nr:tRNA dihydrouridine(20/20a) synthase DusA [bacterium]